MRDFENTFIRGPSPTYSDEGASATQPQSLHHESFFDEKIAPMYTNTRRKQGRNTFAFWTIVMVLLVLTVGNLILTLSIIGVLHVGKGIRGLEFNSEEGISKFFGSTDLDRLYLMKGATIDGFSDVPVSLETELGGSINVRLQQRNGQYYNRFTMDETGIQFRSINNFEIKDPSNGNTIFTTHRPHYNMPNGVDSLLAKTVSTSRISSQLDKPLVVDGDGHISIKGSEGIFIDGANILLQSENNILVNGSQIMLEGGSGIFLDMEKIPIVSSEFGLRTGSLQYKICACMPQGILFRIPIPRIHNGPKITCAHFSSLTDPCDIN